MCHVQAKYVSLNIVFFKKLHQPGIDNKVTQVSKEAQNLELQTSFDQELQMQREMWCLTLIIKSMKKANCMKKLSKIMIVYLEK